MPSEMARVFSHGRGLASCAGLLLVCLFGGQSAGFSATTATVKNNPAHKPAQTAKSVFSVSARDSAASIPGSSVTSAPKADSAPQAAKKTAAKDTASAAPASPATHAAPAVLKKTIDTLKKFSALPATSPPKVPAPPVEGGQKRNQKLKNWNSPLLVKTIALVLCAVLILAALRFVTREKATVRFLTTTRLSVMDKEVQRACRYIEKNFADPGLSLGRMCKDLVTGEAFLEALMERDLGVTVNDFIVHVRINQAKQILAKAADADSEAIARETGFASGAAFCAAFRKITDVPFDEYVQRRNLKNG